MPSIVHMFRFSDKQWKMEILIKTEQLLGVDFFCPDFE